ncbi:MAG: hypothetical protein LUI04_00990 [Porphyromonadaceae bacterium]|nr:hypothetical protein [Porphyromonadaceae bacterium]
MQSGVIDHKIGLTPEIEPTEIDIPDAVKEAIAAGLPIENYRIAIDLSQNAEVNPKDLSVSEDIKRIDTVLFSTPKEAKLILTPQLLENMGTGDHYGLSLSDVNIHFPKMLMLQPSGEIGDITIEDNSGNFLSIKNHEAYIDTLYSPTGTFELTLPIYGLYGGEVDANGENYFSLTLANDEKKLDIIGQTFELTGEAEIELTLSGNVGTTLSTTPQINTDFTIEELTIYRVTGIIDASSEESFTVEIGSMPDFLSDNDIQLDLTNPYIQLNAENSVCTPVKAILTVDPKDDKGISILTEPVVIDTISIQPASYDQESDCIIPQWNYIYISPKAPEQLSEEKTFYLNDTLYTWVQGDLPSLFNTQIPSSLEASIIAFTDTTLESIALFNDLSSSVEVDCHVTVPLEFGEEFAIHYSDIEDGLDDIFKDVSAQEAVVIANYSTTFPLNLLFSLTPLQEINSDEYALLADDERIMDEEDESTHYFRILQNIEINILDADQSGQGIIQGTDDLQLDNPTPATGKIVICLYEKEENALKQVTHLQYSVEGNLADGLSNGLLRSTQYLQLQLSAKVANIEIDLDSL